MGLEYPLLQLAIVLSHFAVELACDSGDGLLVADVGETEPAAGHAADLDVGTDHYHIQAHPGGTVCGHDGGGGASINANVIAPAAGNNSRSDEYEGKQPFHHFSIL